MRTMMRSGPLLLALGMGLTGCGQSGNPAQTGVKTPSKNASVVMGPDVLPGSSQVVLTVEGMT
jgi:hypothetical protein